MHVRIRFHPDTMGAKLTMVVGPLGFEDSSPALEKVWREQQAAPLNEALSRSHFVMRVRNAVLPRVIVEWPECGFRYALQVDDGIAQWVWISDDHKRTPRGAQVHFHHFVGGMGQLVPVTKKTLQVIEAFASIYADPLGYHYLPCRSHEHCVVNLWLKFGFQSDSPKEREHMTLTACEYASITDVFKKVSGFKAEAERFCLMPVNWVDGVLVKGTPISYQSAKENEYSVNEMGWGEEVWLWPCAPLDELVSSDGFWEDKDLVGFSFIEKTHRTKSTGSRARLIKAKLAELNIENTMQREPEIMRHGTEGEMHDAKGDCMKMVCDVSTGENVAVENLGQLLGCANDSLYKVDGMVVPGDFIL